MEIRYRPTFNGPWELCKMRFYSLLYSICDLEHKSQFCSMHLPGGWVDFCAGSWTVPRTGIITHARFLSLPFTLSLSLSVFPNPFPLASELHCYSIVPSTEFPPFCLPFLLYSDSCTKWIFSPGCHIHLVLLEWETILIFPWICVSSACISSLLSCKIHCFDTICDNNWQHCDATRSSVVYG